MQQVTRKGNPSLGLPTTYLLGVVPSNLVGEKKSNKGNGKKNQTGRNGKKNQTQTQKVEISVASSLQATSSTGGNRIKFI